jgi:hypothetical protein
VKCLRAHSTLGFCEMNDLRNIVKNHRFPERDHTACLVSLGQRLLQGHPELGR